MECKHIFEGRADGVHCKLCGLHIIPEAYAAYLSEPQQAPTESKNKKPPAKLGRKGAET